MEIKNFKMAAFGGFDKADVISYIQKTAQEHEDALGALQRETAALREENSALKGVLEQLKAQHQQAAEERDCVRKEYDRVCGQLEEEAAARKALEQERPDLEELIAQLDEMQPQAEAYQKIKDQVGDIECQARKRASELEIATMEKLDKLVAELRQQHGALANMFNTAANHMHGELRKLEVELTQLPRALDQAGSDLKELEAALGRKKEKNG